MRYDRMVSVSQENSRIKVEIAKHEIKSMLERKHFYTFIVLLKKSFF